MRSDARRWLMAITVLGVVASASGLAFAQAPVGGKKLTVTPAKGGSSTHFVVQFTTTSATTSGTSGGTIRTIEVKASGGRSVSGCVSHVGFGVSAPHPGLQHVTLSPGSGKARWCSATFSGSVVETLRPSCPAGQMCPQYIALETIGTFSFKVD